VRNGRLNVARKICVAGVGAVGATVAARLIEAGQSAVLYARGARLDELRRCGLNVEFADRTVRVEVTASDRADFGVQDIVFLAAKAQGLPQLLKSVSPLIGPSTTVVPLVNGIPWWYFQGEGGRFDGLAVEAVDPGGQLCRSVDARQIVGCVLYLTAQRRGEATVTVLGRSRMVVGAISNTTGGSQERAAEVDALLSHAGFASDRRPRIRDELWTKVALNLATNPLSVLTEATLIEQFTDARLLPIVTAVIAETLEVAAALGASPTMTLEQMIGTGRQAGPFETSMLQDYRAKRPLELDAIAHAVLELAAKVGVHMPVAGHIVNLCAHRADARRPSVN
jgi:2-dehydropantoate 2-reductase